MFWNIGRFVVALGYLFGWVNFSDMSDWIGVAIQTTALIATVGLAAYANCTETAGNMGGFDMWTFIAAVVWTTLAEGFMFRGLTAGGMIIAALLFGSVIAFILGYGFAWGFRANARRGAPSVPTVPWGFNP